MSISKFAHIAGSSFIAPGAVIGANVNVGPFCTIASDVVIGDRTIIGSHCVLSGSTQIGSDNVIGNFSSVGEVNQDLKYRAEPTKLLIGDRNKIGKNTTIHRGTSQGSGCTSIGNDNVFLNNVHIGHDCVVGNHVYISDNSGLAGHVDVGDGAVIGFMCAIHQYCVLGAYTNINDQSGVVQDVPPFVSAAGNHATPVGLNTNFNGYIGLKIEEKFLLYRYYNMLYQQCLSIHEVKSLVSLLFKNHPFGMYFEHFFIHSRRGVIR